MNSIRIVKGSRSPEFRDLKALGQSIDRDWFGTPLANPVRLIFWVAEERFHFLIQATPAPGLSHPGSHHHQYQAELWKYDVAEFFISDPTSGRYLEFNLAPNGAWWSCGFSAPREPSPGEPSAIPGVKTLTRQDSDSWLAQASLPLSWLQKHYNFGPDSKINATFILGSPRQIFLTAAAPADGEPDFHRSAEFLKSEFIALA